MLATRHHMAGQPALPRLHQLPYAAALVLAVLALPKGLAGLVRRA